MIILLGYVRSQIRKLETLGREKGEWKEKRGWLLFKMVMFLAISLVAPYKLLGLLIGQTWGLAVGVVLLPIVAFLSVYFILAPNNCSFTFIKEGTAKYVVRGDKFEKCLMQWKDHTFDEEWNVVLENTWIKDGKKVQEGVLGAKKHKESWHPFGGLRFYGIWPIFDIHIYKFRWTGVTESGEDQHKEEWLDFILLQEYTYKGTVEKAEDKELLPLDLEVWLPTKIVNPRKARFDVQDWLETVIKRIQPVLRQRVAKEPYKKLNTQLKEISEEMTTSEAGKNLLGKDGEFVKLYGVLVRTVELRQIKPPDNYLEATLKEFVAKQEKKATITKAEGEKKALMKVYSQIQNFGDLGKLLRTLEAVEKSPLAASVTIQAIPGLQEILRGVFGRPAEEITLKEIRELRGMIEKALKTKRR
jgi:hypothetical protein